MKKWTEKFADPSSEYRPHPFWSWNDKLDKAELKRQISELAETGHGGFFMHARHGLRTPYMQDEWFECVKACTEESKKQGVRAWCYDEFGWPSGNADGAVCALGEDYCCRWIKLLTFDGTCEGEPIAFYALTGADSYRYVADTHTEAVKSTAEGEVLVYVSSFFDKDYIDILDPAVVRAFIEHTHEVYLKNTDGELSSGALHGFFTDEPQYALCKTPWSKVIFPEFKTKFGYSLKEVLPSLFLNSAGYEKVRYDFWSLVNKLFTESFAKQIYSWCDEHGCKLTGHSMMEDNLLCQIHCTAGCMPIYEYMHVPGVDWLGRYPQADRLSGASGSPVLPLQVGSAAAQLGKRHVITESFAMAGWDATFAELRHIVEWQFLGGVNLLCQHLEAYSIRGRRKNDFPPAFSHQSPMREEYKAFNDVISRTGKLLADGVNDPHVLLIHPMHSVWLKYNSDDMNGDTDYDNAFTSTAMSFMEAHLPYHFGDETIISRHGSVKDGAFYIGNCSYHTVFLPNLRGLDRKTFELLCEFASCGGRVVVLDGAPEYIDGVRAREELENLLNKCDKIAFNSSEGGSERLKEYISCHKLRDFSLEGNFGEEKFIHLTTREYPHDDVTLFFLVNFDRSSAHKVKLSVPTGRAVSCLSVETMELSKPTVTHANGHQTIELEFEPISSKIVLLGVPSEDASTGGVASVELPLNATSSVWKIGDKSAENCLLLDRCSVGKGSVFGEDIYAQSAYSKVMRESCDSLRYTFTVSPETDLSRLSNVRFVTEFDSPVTVTVNGKNAEHLSGEWWLDHSFTVYSAGAHLCHGENSIVITDFVHTESKDGKDVNVPDSPFSFAYLVGDFGVFAEGGFKDAGDCIQRSCGKFYVADKPHFIKGANIVDQGFPFFRGKMILEREIEVSSDGTRRHVCLKGSSALCARVRVNGKLGPLVAWDSLTDDITDRSDTRKNSIALELVYGNRNLLGPHHAPLDTASVGPCDFELSESKSTDTKHYNFVKSWK